MATKAMINGTLNLVIVEAENLKKKDLLNKMDPYCVVEFNDETFKTEPHKKGHKNPTWEESLKIPVKGKSLSEKIVFSVYDKELIHDNKIGRAEFTLQKLADLGQKEDLCSMDLETFGFVDKHKPAGTLKIRINFTGEGWPGSEKEEDSDKPKMPKKDDKVFKEHKNLKHFADGDSTKNKVDTDVDTHDKKDKVDNDLDQHKKYLEDTKDKVPIHPKKEHHHHHDISKPVDDNLDKEHHHKKKHVDDSTSKDPLKESDFQRDPVKDLPKEYRNVDKPKTHPASIEPEKIELGNLEERQQVDQPRKILEHDIPEPISERTHPVEDTDSISQTNKNLRRGSVGGTCDLNEREKMAELESKSSILDSANNMLERGKTAVSDTVAGVSNYLSSDIDKSKTVHHEGILPQAKAAISDTVSSVSNYFTGTTDQPMKGSVGGTCNLAEREKMAKLEQVQDVKSGIISTISGTLSSVAKPVSGAVSSVSNYFTGTTDQPMKGSVGGTCNLAEREKMAKLEQVQDVKSGIISTISNTLSSVAKPVSGAVSSVSHYFTGTPTDQPMKGSVGGTCDLAEREKMAKLEQVQIATSGIVPRAKAAISDISNTLSSVTKPVSNYFTGTTADQPMKGSVGGTCNLAEREKMAKLEQVQDVKSGIISTISDTLSSVAKPVSGAVSSVSNYFTGTPTDQPRRGSVGGTCDLAEREKMAKLEQVQVATSGIVPKAKAAISEAISSTVAGVTNFFSGQKEEKDVIQDDIQDSQEIHQGTATFQPTKMDGLVDTGEHEAIGTGMITDEPHVADKGLLERGKEYITDTAKAVSDYMAPKENPDAPWKKDEHLYEGTPEDQLPSTSLVNPVEMIPHDMREKSLFQKGKDVLVNTASTVTDTATSTATNLKNYFAPETKQSTDPNEKGLLEKAKETISSTVPSASNAERAPWKKEEYHEGNTSVEEMPATSLVNPNEMIPHDKREKSLFQKGKEALENATATDTTTKDFQFTDTNKAFEQHPFHTDKEKMLQDNNSNKLSIEDSLDKGKAKDLHYQHPELAYHNEDV